MNRTPLRVSVLNLLTQEPVNLSLLYGRSGLTSQAILQALKAAAAAGLCVLAPERRRTPEKNARYTARITVEGLQWLQQPEAVVVKAVKKKGPQGEKYAGIDTGVREASAWLRSAW